MHILLYIFEVQYVAIEIKSIDGLKFDTSRKNLCIDIRWGEPWLKERITRLKFSYCYNYVNKMNIQSQIRLECGRWFQILPDGVN